MSGKMIDFCTGKEIKSESERYDPHIGGECHCIGCGHEWTGIAPVGTIQLQCPKCNCYKGHFKYLVLREGPHLTCDCGNDLLHVMQEGMYCPNCGVDFL